MKKNDLTNVAHRRNVRVLLNVVCIVFAGLFVLCGPHCPYKLCETVKVCAFIFAVLLQLPDCIIFRNCINATPGLKYAGFTVMFTCRGFLYSECNIND